ncbi:MAG: hypothetical protein ACE15F_14810 [bacterium]
MGRVYIGLEPDQGGKTFKAGILMRLAEIGYKGEIRIFDCGEFKDPSALCIDNPDEFSRRFEEILATAEPVDLADFAKFAAAVETGLEVDPLAQAIGELVDNEERFDGAAGELYARLESMPAAMDKVKRSRNWPQSARGLRASLKRIKPLLEKTGICIEFSKIKHNGHYPIRLCRKNGGTTSPTSPGSVDGGLFPACVSGTFPNWMRITRP